MILWSAIFILAAIVAVAMFFAGRRGIPDSEQFGQASSEEQFRVQLTEIEADAKFSRLNPAEAEAAKAEIARELMRQRAADAADAADADAAGVQMVPREKFLNFAIPATSAFVAVLAIGVYMLLGSPEQPSVPYADHIAAVEKTQAEFGNAITRVEQQLKTNPDNVRGWSVIAPAYMQARRYQDAANAFRKILQLSTPTAEMKTNLAEALMMVNNGQITPEVTSLLQSAADMDETNVRARFYLAGEATRAGEWDNAIARWNKLIGMAGGGEPWLKIAEEGLAVATARGVTPAAAQQAASDQTQPASGTSSQSDAIKNMVEGLSARLMDKGGTLEEWTRLVRSQLVLGETAKARKSYLLARAAYPDATQRSKLDDMAAQAGILTANAPDVTLEETRPM